ncbi:carboxypeptidase regulatory-like domain-containing protein [Micromonospora sp. WMMD980]|uniref:carboxypeptidase-like regulatory domain-containing protein n=1 Tax=Micromonospora sp. WMMD980 TaxID=3016088 RepID=UPI002417D53A|nr:carboxypeptidase regulatory-like domain-containing protein [Micromonospora sp. WMMD980]MDG4803826.1 carboxypeptidase regulatory-like domain-containing protein [Micromonospora sp. WMMD980]
MSTHRRAWKHRAGVVVALVFGALLTVPATPALAASIVTATNSVSIDAGKSSQVVVKVRLGNGETSADIDVSDLPDGVNCGGCGSVDFKGGQETDVTLTLSAAGDAPANNALAKITVTGGGVRPLRVAVKAAAPPPPQQPQTVKTVSGKVINSDGEPISGALVMLRDSAGKERRTNTNGSGNFSFSGSVDNPIAPGRIDLGASADGASPTAKSINAAAGQSATGIRLSIAVKAASESPSASPSASESAPPSEEATEEAASEPPASDTPAAPQPAASEEDSGGFGSWLLILLGGLFVAVGVGTIVLLYMRRKNEDGDGPDGPIGPGGPDGAGAIPAARGAYRGADDQTRMVNGMGAGPAPTMVGGAALSEAPTMLQRPVVDDVPPDPYGAPPGPAYGVGAGQGGYGYGENAAGPGGNDGYGNAPSSGGGYGSAPSSGGGYGNGPSSGAGYGGPDYAAGYPPAQGGGYGNERFDEPTGRYPGDGTQYTPAADPYPTSTYQSEADRGYEQIAPGQYGRGSEQGDGYRTGGGYGDAPSGYDNASGGYDGGRQQAGYGDRPTGDYDADPAGGYGATRGATYGDAPTGGYGDTPGYGGGRPGSGYDSPPTGGYDSASTGGYDSASTGGYDSGRPTGGYGDAPTGGYDATPAGGYDGRQSGGYDGGQAGYGQQGGYDGGQQGGYEQRPGYGDGYGQSPQGGYGQGGYGDQAGYGDQEPPQQRGGYDNQGGYHNDPAQAGRARDGGQPDRGGRRLDWLDD